MTNPHENLCNKVRHSCSQWMGSSSARRHVTIDQNALKPLMDRLVQAKTIQWDEESWHYQPPSDWPMAVRRERIARYIIALDAINFCFWPSQESYEYEDIAVSLTRIASSDHDEQAKDLSSVSKDFLLSPDKLMNLSPDDMKMLFQNAHKNGLVPPDIDKRAKLWNELGRVLHSDFGSSVVSMIEMANGSAVSLVGLIFHHFQGFRDCTQGIYFLKRAQICVGDLNAALELNLSDLDQMTTFADYRVPQILAEWKVINYSHDLEAKIRANEELDAGSEEELSIRVATVVAVEMLVECLNNCGLEKTWTAVETDWYLWQVAEKMQASGDLSMPHHRVRTIYY